LGVQKPDAMTGVSLALGSGTTTTMLDPVGVEG
jgi:hypothetical protein